MVGNERNVTGTLDRRHEDDSDRRQHQGVQRQQQRARDRPGARALDERRVPFRPWPGAPGPGEDGHPGPASAQTGDPTGGRREAGRAVSVKTFNDSMNGYTYYEKDE